MTKFRTQDLWCVRGVDQLSNYGGYDAAQQPLIANQRPIPDPFENIPVPTTASDPSNVNSAYRGSVTVVGLPILTPQVVLQPGVYDSINIVSGRVRFSPGIYIIRSMSPVTGSALTITSGEIVADGVLFYITDLTGYLPQPEVPITVTRKQLLIVPEQPQLFRVSLSMRSVE